MHHSCSKVSIGLRTPRRSPGCYAKAVPGIFSFHNQLITCECPPHNQRSNRRRLTTAPEHCAGSALIYLEFFCRRITTSILEAANLGLGSFEQRGIEFVPLQQLVKFGAVALGKLGSLRHVAGGDFEQPRQVVALKLLARLLERREFGLLVLNRLLHQRDRNQRRVAQRRRLLDHVVELAYVARPGGAYQQFERRGRDAIAVSYTHLTLPTNRE